MTRFVLHRLLLTIPALFGLFVLTFIMMRVLPNDPSAALAGENATPAQIAAVRKAYGFDEPLWKQFSGHFFVPAPKRTLCTYKVYHSQSGGTVQLLMPQQFYMAYG